MKLDTALGIIFLFIYICLLPRVKWLFKRFINKVWYSSAFGCEKVLKLSKRIEVIKSREALEASLRR